MSKPKPESKISFTPWPKRTEAEAILDGWETARQNAELRQMNGTRCGAAQARSLAFYRRPQRRLMNAKKD
jgi:hypothetical protein